MAGYNYYLGMSNRAVNAYQDGKAPITKITLKQMRDSGWNGTKKEALILADQEKWKPCEWHHSGGTWYNKVSFYDPNDLANLSPKDIDQSQISKDNDEKRVKGSFVIWGGSRKRPKQIGDQHFTGILKNGWIYVDGGGKKKATGNWITWEAI
jgi:hypothetical protein